MIHVETPWDYFQAVQDGAAAFHSDAALNDNPYPTQSPLAPAWIEGWKEARDSVEKKIWIR